MENSDVEQIKTNINISDLISEYVKLKKAGSGFVGLCPFHNEKSPSFNVSPSRGIYKCFGCGESGDIFSFVQKFENLNFPETKKKLAQKACVMISDTFKNNSKEKEGQEKKRKEKESLKNVLECATVFFQVNLGKSEDAKNYLKKRGVDKKMAQKFRLGFAPNEWNNLENHLIKKSFSREQIMEVGLTKKNEKGSIYDRFRNRIIFPIFDQNGFVIAYSGRDLSNSDKVAKYLNSPNTIFFDKSKALYGLNFAKIEARKRKYFILTEGQMDILMSHKAGFINTVATSGTSLTDFHLKNLSYFSKNLVFAFDSDKAGMEASFRGFKKALSMGFDIKILDIPTGFDPADIILKDENQWIEIVKNSKNIIKFFIKKITMGDKNIKQKNKQLKEKIYPLLSQIADLVERDYYVAEILKNFEFTSKESILAELSGIKEKVKNNNIDSKKIEKKEVKEFDIFKKDNIIEKTKSRILKQLTAIYYWQKNLNKLDRLGDTEYILHIIKSNSSDEIYKKILDLEYKKEYLDTLIFDAELLYSKSDKHSMEFDIKSMENRLHVGKTEQKILKLQKRLDLEDEKNRSKILEEIVELTNKKNDC